MRGALCFALASVAACAYESPRVPSSDDVQADAAPADPEPDPPPPGVVDTDNDGVPDDQDNCPTIANAGQADEDADLVGNACDNCPHVANADQKDVLETQSGATADGVGDACDPQPTTGGNRIALFLPFDSADEIADWSFAGNLSKIVAAGSLTITGTDLAILFKNNLAAANSFVITNLRYDVIDGTKEFRGATIMTRFRRTTDFGHGAGCGEMRDTLFNNNNPFRAREQFNGAGFIHNPQSGSASVSAGKTVTYTARGIPGQNAISCGIDSATFTDSIDSESGTGINFAVWGATVSFRYLVVID